MNSLFQPDKPNREHMTDSTPGEFPLETRLMQHLCHAKIRSQLSTQLIWCTLSVLTCQEEQQPTENKFCAV